MQMEPAVGQTMFESTGDEPSQAPIELRKGESISRYMLLDRLGAGGMGVVWAAFDPELDRKLAIKLLHPRASTAPSAEARARLIREAQAMARLSHPHVIAVHDVGEHAGQVFVAMEFVSGGTLTSWLRAQPRSWSEIVAVFVQAGRGLAAAHAAGLIHRDFKPDNVLIGENRVRVTDFGLARSLEGGERVVPTDTRELSTTHQSGSLGSGAGLHTPLTRTGMMLGTPAYMAPEQFVSGRFDARSDQFSFCVALWEALYEQRPFVGRTLGELIERVTSGEIAAPPHVVRVPSFIERTLRRGLAREPEQRWPNMDALLHELEHDPALGRRRWLVGGGLAACLAGAALLGRQLVEPPASAPELCPRAEDRLADIWDPPRREQLVAALDGRTWIPETLDRYASAWLDMHRDACAATRIRGEQSEELLDLRMQCLDERRMHLDVTVETLLSRDVADAMQLLGSLPTIERCADRDYLESQIPIPDDVRLAEQVAQVRAQLAEARAKVDVGLAEEALPSLEAALARSEALAYPPLHAQALTELGFAEAAIAPAAEVRERLETAMYESVRSGQDELAARAGTELVYVIGTRLQQSEEGLAVARLVHAWHDRSNAPSLDRAALLLSEGSVLFRATKYPLAEQRLLASLALLGLDESLVGIEQLDPRTANIASMDISMLAINAQFVGDYARARAFVLADLSMQRQFSTSNDRKTLLMTSDLVTIELMLGHWQAAVQTQAQVTRAAQQSTSDRAIVLINDLQFQLTKRELGFATDTSAQLSIEELRPAKGERAYLGIEAFLTLAHHQRLAGEHELAAASLVEAEQLLDDHSPPFSRVLMLLERGAQELATARPSEALASFAAAERAVEAYGSREQPYVALALTGQARALRALARDDEAKPKLLDALAIWTTVNPDGHPFAIPTLELLAELEPGEPARAHRAAATRIRERVQAQLEPS